MVFLPVLLDWFLFFLLVASPLLVVGAFLRRKRDR